MDRDCKTCAYSSPGEGIGNGCTAWECEYINRQEAIKVYKTVMLRVCEGLDKQICGNIKACDVCDEEERHGDDESGKTD